MAHPIHRITSFHVVGPFTLTVAFSDDTEHRIDFLPVLHGALFWPLQDPRVFNRVALDSQASTFVWPNGAGSDPATLRD